LLIQAVFVLHCLTLTFDGIVVPLASRDDLGGGMVDSLSR